MKLAKVIKAKTYENEKGLMVTFVATIKAEVSPQEYFRSIGLEGKIMWHTVSMVMPLPMALAYSKQVQATGFQF